MSNNRPKRTRKNSDVDYSEVSPEKDKVQIECSSGESTRRKQRKRKKSAPRSKKRRITSSFIQKSDPSVPPAVEAPFSNENSVEPSAASSQSAENNKDLESLLNLSSNCKEHLMRIVSTAVQFQRHSRHPKLCSSHFSKALALEEDFNPESDDSDDFQDLIGVGSTSNDVRIETEEQRFTCHGRWLNHC